MEELVPEPERARVRSTCFVYLRITCQHCLIAGQQKYHNINTAYSHNKLEYLRFSSPEAGQVYLQSRLRHARLFVNIHLISQAVL